MFYGKLIGGLIGLLTGGLVGLALGVLVGHFFDRGLAGIAQFASPEAIRRIRTSFFEASFLLSGYIAKADGRVSEHEIAHIETVFAQMGLSTEQRQKAIDLFKRGSAADFQPEDTIAEFVRNCGHQRQLQQTLLLFLISLALADQQIDAGEQAALQRIASGLNVSAAQLEQLLRMVRAQEHFHGQGGYSAQPGTSLDDAYAALGVESGIDDKALKRAYRKLMSENHPDKLIAKGVPEDMVKLATERSQEIQAAYEMIRKSRQLRNGD